MCGNIPATSRRCKSNTSFEYFIILHYLSISRKKMFLSKLMLTIHHIILEWLINRRQSPQRVESFMIIRMKASERKMNGRFVTRVLENWKLQVRHEYQNFTPLRIIDSHSGQLQRNKLSQFRNNSPKSSWERFLIPMRTQIKFYRWSTKNSENSKQLFADPEVPLALKMFWKLQFLNPRQLSLQRRAISY